MDKKYIIYLHRNKINNKCYIGQTCQKPKNRWGTNGNGYKDQAYFYRAIQKYGWDNFEHIILEENINEEDINARELYWSGYYHSLAPEGYNFKVGEQHHYAESEEYKKQRSKQAKEVWQRKEYQELIRQKRKEEWQNPELREKCLKNLDHTGKNGKLRSKAIQCIETQIIYPSMREAERLTGIPHSNISEVCNGRRQTAGGFHWKFYVDLDR